MNQKKIEQFVAQEMAGFDPSHDFNHALAVTKNTAQILSHMKPEDLPAHVDATEITYLAAMLHDVADHKYLKGQAFIEAKTRLEALLDSVVLEPEKKIVLDIIGNVSFSKEKRGELQDLGPYQVLRDVVSDADKLEALGDVGLQRAIDFATARHPGASDEAIRQQVVDHAHDKLLHLIDYFRTEPGRALAARATEPIKRYVDRPVGLAQE